MDGTYVAQIIINGTSLNLSNFPPSPYSRTEDYRRAAEDARGDANLYLDAFLTSLGLPDDFDGVTFAPHREILQAVSILFLNILPRVFDSTADAYAHGYYYGYNKTIGDRARLCIQGRDT